MQQQQQQQHLMQMQPIMAAYYSNNNNNNNVTTDHIQQYLDENKSLILKIVESQNSGKLNECAENQARLQRNLMYLAAIADAQPQQAAMHSQYPQSSMMQSGGHYMQQHQQSQQMTPQALMAARSSMMYSQQAYSALQQSQMGLSMLHSQGGEPHNSAGSSGILGGGAYSDFGRGLKHEMGSSEGRGGSLGDGEGLYLKSGEDGH